MVEALGFSKGKQMGHIRLSPEQSSRINVAGLLLPHSSNSKSIYLMFCPKELTRGSVAAFSMCKLYTVGKSLTLSQFK